MSFISINTFKTQPFQGWDAIFPHATKFNFLKFGKIALSLNSDTFLDVRDNYISGK